MDKENYDPIEGDRERKYPGLFRRLVTYPSILAQRRLVEDQLRKALKNNSSELPDILARASFVRYLIKDKLLQRVLDDPASIQDVMHQLREGDREQEAKKEARREKRRKRKEKEEKKG
jgi:hypothetical protein